MTRPFPSVMPPATCANHVLQLHNPNTKPCCRYTKVHLVRLSPSVGEASLIAQASKAPLPKDKAMTAWSSVMLALAAAAPGKQPLVPSRESVMTRLLHDSVVI